MMYDAVPEQMLEQVLTKSCNEYLQAETLKDKVILSKIFCDVTDRTIKLISVQDDRNKEEMKLEAEKERDAKELELKNKQFDADEKNRAKEIKIKNDSIELELNKAVNQRILDVIKFGVGTLVTVGLNLLYIRFDAKGNMFTTSFGRKRADESTRLKF